MTILENWRNEQGGNATWSIRGPSKGVRLCRYQVTLYRYISPRWRNVASKAGDTVDEAAQSVVDLWRARETAE